jgi:transcriptional regulator with XRE-family HTH domain
MSKQPPTKPTIGSRVKVARLARGFSIAGLSRALNPVISAGAISQWEMTNGRETDPNHENLARVARALNVDLTWLATGQGKSGLELPSDANEPGGRRIPIRTTAQIVNRAPGSAIMYSVYPCGPKAFAHVVASGNGGALAPRGATIVIDPDERPEHNHVIAALVEERLLLGRLVTRREKGVTLLSLAPLADGWPTETIEVGDILGRITEVCLPQE